MHEHELLEKLRKIERLFAGATTPGEKEAAADAMRRIQARLHELTRQEGQRPGEYKFTLVDAWSKKLFIALLRRYGLHPYRYARQRRNTVMVRVPARFVEETLWPEFMELSTVLQDYLREITDRVIAEGIHGDMRDEEIIAGEYLER